MATVTLNGQIESISAVQQLSTTQKRTFVLFIRDEREERYSDHIEIEVLGDKVNLLDQFKINETVEVQAFLRGRAWTSQDGTVKHFLSLSLWKIGTPQTQFATQAPQQYAGAQPQWGAQSVNYPPTQAMQGKTPQMGQQPLFNNDGTPTDAPF